MLKQLQQRVPGLVIEGARGSLRGGDFSADRIELPLPGEPGKPGGRMVLSGVKWSGLKVDQLLSRTPYAHLHFDTLEADRLDVELPPSPDEKKPAQVPTSLALPVTADIDRLRVGEIHAAALGDKPVRDVRARVSLGAERHRVEDLSFAWDKLSGRGEAQIATGGKLDLDAKLAVEGDSGDPRLGAWQAQITASGPLERIETSASLRGLPAGAATAAPAAGASAPGGATAAPAGPAAAPAPSGATASAGAGTRPAPAAALPAPAPAPAAGAVPASAGAAQAPSPARPGGERGPATSSTSAAMSAPTSTRAGAADAPARAGRPAAPAAPAAAGASSAAAGRGAAAATAAQGASPSPAAGTPSPLPEVDLEATVTPFADWPLGALQGRAKALDLSALASGLPKTRIDASADLQSSALDRPLAVALDLRNEIPGRWDESRLPVRSARLDVRARVDDLATIDVPTLDLQLGNGQSAGGRLTGSGRWKAPGWTLDLKLDDLLPAQLDARAPPMRLSGPVKLRGEHFGAPAPADAATPAGAASAAASAPAAAGRTARAPRAASAAAGTARAAAAPQPTVEIDADLAGELLSPPGSKLPKRPLKLALDARANADDIVVRSFEAASGKARAEASGRVSRDGAEAPWQLAGKARLADFDPVPWLPASVPGEWKRGPHRLNASSQFDLVLPTPAPAADAQRTAAKPAPAGKAKAGAKDGADANPLAALAGLRGTASLAIRDSLLAGVPLKGDADLRSGGGDAMQVAATLDAAGNTAAIDGTLDLRAGGAGDRWKIDAAAPALARLAPVLKLAGLEGPAAELSGALDADARLSGRWPRVTTQGSASVRQLQAGGAAGFGVAEGSLRWQLDADADARLPGGWPRVTTQGSASVRQLQAGGAAGLGVAEGSLRWQLGTAANAPAQLDLDLKRIRSGEMVVDSAGAQLQGTAASHTLDARAELRGRPPAWAEQVQAALTGSAPPPAAAASGAPAKPAARGAGTAPARTTAAAASPRRTAAPAAAAATKPAPAGSTATAPAAAGSAARSAGTAARPAPAAAASPASGERTVISLQARGGLDTAGAAPRWRGTLRQLVAGSARPGRPPWASVENVDIDVQAPGEAVPARVAVSPGRASVLGAALRWDRISWQAALGSQPQRLEARVEAGPLPVAPILQTLQPDFGWSGDLRVAATAVVRSTPQVQVDVVVERVGGDLSVTDEGGTRALGLTDLRLGVAADNGVWQFTQAFAGRRLGNAAGAVTVRTSPQAYWPPPSAPMEGVLEAHVEDLSAWGAWLPPGWRVSGRIDTTASISGRFGAPQVAGSVTGNGLGVRNVLEGINVTDGELRIALAGDTARIERFVLRGGAGTLRIGGSANLGAGLVAPPSAPDAPPPVAPPPSADLRVVADRFRLLARVDRRVVVSGEARMILKGDDVKVAGGFKVDEGLIDFTRSEAPSLSDDVVVIRSADNPDPNAEPTPAAPTGASPFDVSLDLTVDLGSSLRLRGRGIDTGLAGRLHVTAPGGKLAVEGTVNTVGGTYNAYNQKLNIERGIITFTGPVENPRLDIQAMRASAATDISDVRVGVLIGGTAVAPRVRLYSEPDMSDTDKLSYLVLGRAPDGLGGSEIAILQQAAVALLSGEGEGSMSKFTKALGLDSLAVRQGAGGLQSTIVSLGKQISSRWYVGYERSLNATAGNFQLVYRVARRLTIRGQSGADNSIDVIWTWRWQ